MKGIQERKNADGSKVFRAQVRIKGFKPVSATFSRKSEALRWKQQTETEVRQLRYFPDSEARKHTVAALIDRFIAETFPSRRSKQTPQQTLQWWKEHLGHLTLDRLTTAVIKEHLDSLAFNPSDRTGRPLSPRTLNCYLETFSAALSKGAKEYGWLQENPASRIKRKRLPQGRVRYLDSDELARFKVAVKKSENPYLKLAVLLSLCTGGRKSEILSLRWADIDLKVGKLTFRLTKTDIVRSVAVRGEALDCLREHAQTYRFSSEYLFPSRKHKWKGGTAKRDLPWEDPRSAFEVALMEAKITNFRWHDMRHCAASYLLASGATLGEVGKILGHATSAMVWRYAHLAQCKSDELVDEMARVFLPS